MRKRLWLSVGMLAAGASLLVVAGLAGPAASGTAAKNIKNGGTFKYATTSDVDHIDPALAYGTLSWSFQYATALKLYNYPDANNPKGSRLLPEGASGVKVSKDGRTYTFTIKPGFRFSDGTKVTAANYNYAFSRQLNKDLQGSFAQFISDKSATNVVSHRASGKKFIVKLSRGSGQFLTQIATPFFMATSTKLPLTKEVIGVSGNDLPSAGPYYISSRTPRRGLVMSRNKFYKGKRPHHITELNYSIVGNVQTGFNLVTANEIDRGPIPPAEVQGVANKYGVNKTRFQVRPRVCTIYNAMNNSRPLFRNNVALKKAYNYAIRRKAILQQAGPYAGATFDHILPPAMPGSPSGHVYPLNTPNVKKAKALAKGHTRGGKASYWYFSDSPASVNQMEIDRASLAGIGITIEPKGFRGFDLYNASSTRGAEFDIVQAGWCQDYPDPYDFINILLDGSGIQAENNVNIAYYNNAKYNKKMRAAAALVGKKRFTAYGKLDLDITRNQAPWAVTDITNTRSLFSNRVNVKSLIYQGIYQEWDWAAIALK